MASPAYFNVSVGTTVVQLVPACEGAVGIYNNGTATVYIGYDLNLTTTNGFPIPASSGLGVNSQSIQNTIYAISGSAAQDVRIFLGAL
jgi:hypothetical protein